MEIMIVKVAQKMNNLLDKLLLFVVLIQFHDAFRSHCLYHLSPPPISNMCKLYLTFYSKYLELQCVAVLNLSFSSNFLWINLIPLKSILIPICEFSVLLLGLTSWTRQIWLYYNEVIFKHFWHILALSDWWSITWSHNSINSRFIYYTGPR